MDWFLPFPLQRVSTLFALSLLLLTAWWLCRVTTAAQRRQTPYTAWWGVPGLLALLFSPQAEQPTFFGLGAAALLVAEYWPRAYRSGAATRPGWVWPALGLLLGLALLVSVAASAVSAREQQEGALSAGLACVLAGLCGLCSVLGWPRPRPQVQAQTLGFSSRWKEVDIPEWPDLSVSLTQQGAELTNISQQTLALAGWSPASHNAWLQVRDEQGQPLNTLQAGQHAFLPLHAGEYGVRVWYVTQDQPQAPLLFKANWTPASAQPERVLN